MTPGEWGKVTVMALSTVAILAWIWTRWQEMDSDDEQP